MSDERGFAVMASAVILSLASIVYTANMAHSQLIDNQVLANYYRNSEAFVNAESGVNLVLSKLNDVDIAKSMLSNLPFTYPSEITSSTLYQVNVQQTGYNILEISSAGLSLDGTASRDISLEVYYSVSYDIPISPISSNGKLNIDSTATVNDGCEGVAADSCTSHGNIADMTVISQPSGEEAETELCTAGEVGVNTIDPDAIYSSLADGNGEFKEIINNDWGPANSSDGTVFENGHQIDDMNNANSLFESMFGVTLESGKDILGSAGDIAQIDMTSSNAVSCSEQLQDIDDETTVIYIKGDCNIDQNDASHSSTSENKRFTIGSPENPKMVFIEGGTFTTQPNTGASVVGMLYFIPSMVGVEDESGNPVLDPDTGEQKTQELASVDMGGIRVNGALLSEYKCSHDGYDKTDNKGTKQHFSSRYDKTVLNTLYSQFGTAPVDSSYQLVEGTWRDF